MKNKKLLLITSLIILLPCVVGLFLWEQLPDNMPTHFGASGTPDGWSSRGFAVFGLPLLMLFFHLVIYFATKLDKQNQTGGNRKVLDMILYVFPVVSLMGCGTVYATALGQHVDVSSYVMVFLGLLFVAMGNYMPKCRQNSTLGIKLPWTFHNEENWNKTHRIGGMVMVTGGLLMIVCAMLGWMWGMIVAAVSMILIPTGYSWLLYRKQVATGAVEPGNPKIALSPAMSRVSWVIVLTVVLLLVLVLFTGDIDYRLEDFNLQIRTGRWQSTSIYITPDVTLEYHEEGIDGTRVWGYGSPRLSLGEFKNDEMNWYIRYTYNGCKSCIRLVTDNCIYVLNAKTPEETRALFEQLLDLYPSVG